MKNIRQNLAKNLIELRKLNKLTQAELAEKLNYSDKAISKWEHGESLPDVEVLCQIAELYGVSIDYLVSSDHDETTEKYKISKERANNNKTIITWLSIFSAVLLAFLGYFFILNVRGNSEWIIFIWMVPLCLVIALVFNCIWGKSKVRYILLSCLMWSLFTALALQLRQYPYVWFIYCLGIPGEIIILLISRFGKIKEISEMEKATNE